MPPRAIGRTLEAHGYTGADFARSEVDRMRNLAALLSDLPETRGEPPWPGHEYVRGWGVFGLPFDSGHVLALRVFPDNSFAPYRSLWHRDPGGRWSIHVDGPRLDAACPRYYAPACDHVGHAKITLAWAGPATLRVTADNPALDWTLTAHSTFALDALNAVGGLLPPASWKPPALVRMRELIARELGLGYVEFSGPMPSGHTGTLMPRRMYFVDEASAVLDGVDLGHPVRVSPNPYIGAVPLPARGVLAIGQAAWEIRDPAEYERTRRDTAPAVPPTR